MQGQQISEDKMGGHKRDSFCHLFSNFCLALQVNTVHIYLIETPPYIMCGGGSVLL